MEDYTTSTVKCHLKYSDQMILSMDGVVNDIIDFDEMRETGSNFILCPIIGQPEDGDVLLPTSVGVSIDISDGDVENFVNFVEISYPREVQEEENRDIAVCPGPVFSYYDNALRVAEMIEIYKILGVSKFYIYDASIAEDVAKLLKYYEAEGTVEIFPWNIAEVIKLDPNIIHHYGLLGALNDCFYHATLVDKFKYFIHADFDEIIFPYQTETLTEFLKNHDQPSFHSFVFCNYYFFSEFPNDFSNIPQNAVNKFLFTQAQTTQMKNHTRHHMRSKYIAKTNSVFEVGIHFVFNYVNKAKELKVDVNTGALHHYRDNCAFFEMCESPTEQETYSRKFGERLWRNVDEVCGKVFKDGKCPFGRNVTDDFQKIIKKVFV